MKTCNKCNVEKPLTDFYIQRHNRDGRWNYCIPCAKITHKAYRDANPRPYVPHLRTKSEKRAHLRRKYGLNVYEFAAMFKAQKGRCAICEQYMHPPCVDHNHETKQVRGLLCKKCNSGLGMFQDRLSVVKKALAYMEASEVVLWG